MDDSNYDYHPITDELLPPIQEYRYVSKAALYVRQASGGVQRRGSPIGETYGKTAAEAESKLREKMRVWIASRTNAPEDPTP